MSQRCVKGKATEVSDSPAISHNGALHWNVRDILFKDYPKCDDAPFCPGDCRRCPDSTNDAAGEQ